MIHQPLLEDLLCRRVAAAAAAAVVVVAAAADRWVVPVMLLAEYPFRSNAYTSKEISKQRREQTKKLTNETFH